MLWCQFCLLEAAQMCERSNTNIEMKRKLVDPLVDAEISLYIKAQTEVEGEYDSHSFWSG